MITRRMTEKDREIVVEALTSGKSQQQVAREFKVKPQKVKEVCQKFASTLFDVKTPEIALANQNMWVNARLPVYNPSQLVTRKGMRIIDEMRRDDQVKGCLSLKKAAVIGPGWQLVPGDASEPAPDSAVAPPAQRRLEVDDLSLVEE